MSRWLTHDAMSLCKKQPRIMIYYAYPEGREKFGYFRSTIKERRDEFLGKMNG